MRRVVYFGERTINGLFIWLEASLGLYRELTESLFRDSFISPLISKLLFN